MRAFTIIIAVFVGLAAAACEQALQDLVNYCLDNLQGAADDCGTQEWACLCPAYTKIYSCYNNCPSDPEAPSVKQQQDQYCQYAAQESSSLATKTTGKTSGPTTLPPVTTGPSPTLTPLSSSGSHDQPIPTTGLTGLGGGPVTTTSAMAAPFAVPAGGAVAMFLGVAGLL